MKWVDLFGIDPDYGMTEADATEAQIAELTAERDRARATAVALEQQLARVEALAATYQREADIICPEGEYDKGDKAWRVAVTRRRVATDLRAALDPEADQ